MNRIFSALAPALTTALTTALCLSAPVATAQSVMDCDWRASAWNLAEPWGDSSRTFSNGAVRLALLDTVEPAMGAFHLLILSPPFDEIGGRQCKVVSYQDTIGFAGMDFADLTADYDPAVGLIFALPVVIYDGEHDFANPSVLHLTLNQATGAIGTRVELGPE